MAKEIETVDVDTVIQDALNYAHGVFANSAAANPDQTALAAAILGGACQPIPLDASDVKDITSAVLSQGVTETLTAIGRGKLESIGGIGKFGNG